MLAAALAMLCCTGEIFARYFTGNEEDKGVLWNIKQIARLLKQRKRVQDPSLLSTKNLHEVKHWVEPGNVMLCYNINVML